MPVQKQNRIFILTPEGLKKLQEKIRQQELKENDGHKTLLAFWWKWYCKIQKKRPLKDEALDLWFISLACHLISRRAGHKYTLKKIGALTGLNSATIKGILARNGSYQRTIECCFTAFGLTLEASDYTSAIQTAASQCDRNFVGRQEEVQDLNTLVSRNAKVIVIRAQGGVGKTMLARKYLQQEFGSFLEFPIAKETKDIASIEGLIEEKLRQLGEEPGREFLVSLDRLKRKLQAERIGILIDNLEPALDSAGKFIEAHRRYVELLRVLSDPTVQSITLITSRERLRESSENVQHYLLASLAVEDWEQYFRAHNIIPGGELIATLHSTYGGNAGAMNILRGVILEVFGGDAKAYWKEIQRQDDSFIGRDLKDLITAQLNRLKVLKLNAYKLICRMSYYYQNSPTVSIEELFNLLWDVPKHHYSQAVQSLQDRSLIEFSDGEYWLHPLIRAAAIEQFKLTENWKIAECNTLLLEGCVDVIAIGQIHKNLAENEFEDPINALSRSFSRVSEDVSIALHQASIYNKRLVLSTVADRLNKLQRELFRSDDKYAVRFYPIATRWCNIITNEVQELAKTAELRQEIDSPYIIGVPLTEQQEIFVGRTDISSRIEQLLRDLRRPPLLIYGQRRTGKTSLLNNLGRLLPNSIIPMFVDLQGPASRASDHAGFLYNLAKGMIDSAHRQRRLTLPPLPRTALTTDPFTSFDEWLDQVEAALQDNTALLALDEFEVLDQVLAEGRFSEAALLGMLRNLIQHRLHFKVLLSGSHTLEEFQRWSNYLINAQVLHLGYLQPAEARQLIEQPIEGFTLRYEPAASQRVLHLTQGHPFLVQLLCAEIVALKNEQDPSVRRLATLADVAAAIPAALSSGSMFFSDIERNQVDAPALAVLRYLAAQGEGTTISPTALSRQFSEGWTTAIDLLSKRELIELSSNGYRFQVELIRRWFAR